MGFLKYKQTGFKFSMVLVHYNFTIDETLYLSAYRFPIIIYNESDKDEFIFKKYRPYMLCW